jgi:hypothetical protein
MYAEGYNFELGVREYQKVENPCTISLTSSYKKYKEERR